ncbi:hypothetical protein MMC25_007083 [Agyrium rufum]|nr:hypothetical protein [Agyrium rufum]
MPSSTPTTSNEVFLLPLTDEGAPDIPGGYIYLPPPSDPPYSVRFAIEGTSSICREGSLWVNLPAKGEAFQQENYNEYKLKPDFHGTIQIDIPVLKAGAFAFYTTYTPLPKLSMSNVEAPEPTETSIFYIDVEPSLTLQGEALPIDALSIFSAVSKFMGKYPEDWDKHLKGVGQRGYNMIHFTPLTTRGISNSPYSIYDQLEFDQLCFPKGEKDVAEMIRIMENEYGILGLTDVVWNHTANNSKWLEEHPESGYNVETAPWLESALELDSALLEFGEKLEEYGLPKEFHSVEALYRVMGAVKTHVLDQLKLWEYYVVNVTNDAKAAVAAWMAGKIKIPQGSFDGAGSNGPDEAKDWSLPRSADLLRREGFVGAPGLGPRYHRHIDPEVGAALLTFHLGKYEEGNASTASEGAAVNTMTQFLNELNLPFYREYDADMEEVMEQVFNRTKYVRIDEHGPKLGPVTKENPFIQSYFTRLPLNEITKKHNPKALALVNNGWIWAADAMRDNAGPDSKAYLRREVIIWGDCAKLRYGKGPEDNPFLWEHMTKYSRLMAKYFTGFRIDNCHSTPIHVAEYLLHKAREVRPNLVVFAELFTGSEQMDFVFVERLGLSALIREAMQSWSSAELSRLVHRHGGRPIGSFEINEISGNDETELSNGKTNGVNGTSGLKNTEIVKRIQESPVHALFMDCTHDNEVPAQKRDARDTLPNAALVNMCACATGSVMGYDEIYPMLVEIVHEKRIYTSHYSEGKVEIGGGEGGIGGVKKLLNQIHVLMGQDGYDETHIHHEGEYVTVHRLHPLSRKGYFLVAHTAFPGAATTDHTLSPVHLSATKAKLMGSWTLEVDASEEAKRKVLSESKLLKGLPSRTIDAKGVTIDEKQHETVISIAQSFPPGSIALFETWIPSVEHPEGLDSFVTSGAKKAFAELSLPELNFVLYRCDAEERDFSGGNDGVYSIPNHGPLVYAGLQGWWSVLKDIIKSNNLGHPICNHLREGQWALDYIVGRLDKLAKQEGLSALHKPAQWLADKFDVIRKIPNFLLPRYFAIVIQTAYNAAWDRSISLMSDDIKYGQKFVQQLAMVSVQQTGYTRSASLYPVKRVPCLAAGLPHFSTSWARCWGRDVFISLRGLFLGTGRFDDAKEHILAFASVLKHGMIPNLLGDGKNPRYNSRDSIWFFLQSIQDYTKFVPNGINLLKEKVSRRFLPYDDTYFEFDDPRAYSKTSTIEEIIQEALQRHASGLSFREANAGPNLDMQMKSEGFQIDVKVDWKTGLIFGGNQHNCGTWMDKMGESDKAGSKGVPGTPRDGAAIEITGLAYSTLAWVADLHSDNQFSSSGVKTSSGETVTYTTWSSKIAASFEKSYYVPLSPSEDSLYDINPAIINRRGIYKDLYRSGKEYEDYQLRPNFPIAMTVAPSLFDPEHAMHALLLADKYLRGLTGMATLDPSDLNYRPNYHNSEDSTDFATSKGRNYHQGPEWLWPTGFFLRALLRFDLERKGQAATDEEKTEAFQVVTRRLEGCKRAIEGDVWAGLTELTNEGGSYCADSSPTQAWSAGCLIDLFHDAKQLALE